MCLRKRAHFFYFIFLFNISFFCVVFTYLLAICIYAVDFVYFVLSTGSSYIYLQELFCVLNSSSVLHRWHMCSLVYLIFLSFMTQHSLWLLIIAYSSKRLTPTKFAKILSNISSDIFEVFQRYTYIRILN